MTKIALKEHSEFEKRIVDLCQQLTAAEKITLYDVEYVSGSKTLRVFIDTDNERGIVIDDCAKIDRALTPHLEEEWVPTELTLEVSSPGVYRNLNTLWHFEKARGTMIKVLLHQPLNGTKKIRGILENTSATNITLKIETIAAKKTECFLLPIDLTNIKKANCDPEI